jgi:hypothetical protein
MYLANTMIRKYNMTFQHPMAEKESFPKWKQGKLFYIADLLPVRKLEIDKALPKLTTWIDKERLATRLRHIWLHSSSKTLPMFIDMLNRSFPHLYEVYLYNFQSVSNAINITCFISCGTSVWKVWCRLNNVKLTSGGNKQNTGDCSQDKTSF